MTETKHKTEIYLNSSKTYINLSGWTNHIPLKFHKKVTFYQNKV